MTFSLDHIVIRAADVERLLVFYAGVIGLEAEKAEEFRSGKALFVSLRVDETTIIDLLPVAGPAGEGEGHNMHNMDHFALVVDEEDWEPLMARLDTAGVAIEMGPAELDGARGRGRGVYVRDPEGNRVELRYYG